MTVYVGILGQSHNNQKEKESMLDKAEIQWSVSWNNKEESVGDSRPEGYLQPTNPLFTHDIERKAVWLSFVTIWFDFSVARILVCTLWCKMQDMTHTVFIPKSLCLL